MSLLKFLKLIIGFVFLATVSLSHAGKFEVSPGGTVLLLDDSVKLAIQFDRESSIIPKKAIELRKLVETIPGLNIDEAGSDDIIQAGRADGVVGRDILQHFDLTLNWWHLHYALTPPKASPEDYFRASFKIAFLGDDPYLELDVNGIACRMALTLLTKGTSFNGETFKKLGSVYKRGDEIFGMSRKSIDGLESWFEASIDDDLPSALHGDFGADMILEDQLTISFKRGVFETLRKTKNFPFAVIVATVIGGQPELIGTEFWIPLRRGDGRQSQGKITHIDGMDIDFLLSRYKSGGLKALKSVIENRRARNATVQTVLGESVEIELRKPDDE